MKHLLYKVGFTVLIIAAILSITGGIVSAAPADSNIVAKIDQILNILTGDSGLGSVARIERVAASFQVPIAPQGEGVDPYVEVYVSDYSEVRHVSLTLATEAKDVQDDVFIYVLFDEAASWRLINYVPTDSGLLFTEFDARDWKILVLNSAAIDDRNIYLDFNSTSIY